MKSTRVILKFLMLFTAVVPLQLALAVTDTGTLTVVNASKLCGGPTAWEFESGYVSGALGAYSPTGLTGGTSLFTIHDIWAFGTGCSVSISVVAVSGFSSSPGPSWLSSITCNGVTNTGASGTYSYGSGQASWTFNTRFGLIGLVGTGVACSIVHN